MKKVLLILILAFSSQAFGGNDYTLPGSSIDQCGGLMISISSRQSIACDNRFESRMAEVKVRSLHRLYKYIWKRAKKQDRVAGYMGMLPSYNMSDGTKEAVTEVADDAADDITENTFVYFFKNSEYRLRANTKRFAIKLKYTFK